VKPEFVEWLMYPDAAVGPPTIEDLIGRPAWMNDAACRGCGHGKFVIDPDSTPSEAVLARCARCPVKDECLNYAMQHRNLVGVWGGTTERERRRIRRQRRAVA
jgi:WhiB family transcriptional regulator, redox-sensing transcriptional regulator